MDNLKQERNNAYALGYQQGFSDGKRAATNELPNFLKEMMSDGATATIEIRFYPKEEELKGEN